MRIDFILNTQIENIGQNQPPLLTYFRVILYTAVYTKMDSYGNSKLHLCPGDLVL